MQLITVINVIEVYKFVTENISLVLAFSAVKVVHVLCFGITHTSNAFSK